LVFVYKNECYRCTEKEKNILKKRVLDMNDTQFADLLADFQLEKIV